MFADEHLVPFVEDIMTMEAVAMAIEGAKVCATNIGFCNLTTFVLLEMRTYSVLYRPVILL